MGIGVSLQRCALTVTLASAPLSLAMVRKYGRVRATADVVHVHVPNPWAVLLVLLLRPAYAVVVSVHAASTRYRVLRRPHDALMRHLYRPVPARRRHRRLGRG